MKFNLSYLYIAIFFLGILACKKDNEEVTGMPPHIEGVTFLNDREVFLDSVLFGEWILIKGRNLSSAQSVAFSDVSIPASEFYADDTSISVKIPPTLSDPTNNPITVVTDFGSYTYDFKIVLPPPVIHAVDKLAADENEIITITGDFFLFLSEVKIGNEAAEIVEFDRYSIKIKKPSATASGAISVTTPRGRSVSNKIFGFKYVLFDDEINSEFYTNPYGHNSYQLDYSDYTRRGTKGYFIDFKAGSWGSARFTRSAEAGAIDLTGYTGIKFSYYSLGTQGNNRLRVVIGSGALTIECKDGEWVDVAIPFSSLGNPTTLSVLEIKEYRGYGVPMVLDDIGFY